MAGAPIDYYGMLANVPDPGQKFEEGLLWAKQQKEAAKAAARQAAMEAEYAALSSGPMTAAKLRDFTFKYPEVADKFKGAIDALGADERKAAVQQFIPAATALYSGNAKIAEEQLRTTADAYKNAGNAQMAKMYSDAAESVKIAPEQANVVLSMMANFIDPEWAGKVDTSRKAGADIGKTAAETRGLTATAALKEIEEKFAPEKIEADLGLTKAQAEQARASAAASRANARKTNAEIAGLGTGVLPPDKRAELELKLRNEYANRTATYQDVKQAYGRVQASQDTAAGDLSLIFNYMKMLDPGSAVREGEFANAQNAGGVSDRIRNLYNNLRTGERLNSSQRQMFIGQAKSLYNQSASGEQTIRKGLTRIAGTYGITPDAIFYEATETAPEPPAGAPTAPPPAAVVPPSAASAGGVGSAANAPVRVNF